MGLRTWITGLFAADLPPVAPPKVPNKQQSLPGYRTQRTTSTSRIRKDDRRLADTNLLSYRTARDTGEVVRQLAAASPDLSASTATYLRVGIPEGYVMIARNMDGTISSEATGLAHQLLRRMTYVPDYALGFNPQSSLQSLSEALAKELLHYGALAGEVVLDKARLPTRISPVSVPSIFFYEEDEGVRPVQDIGGQEVSLDVPTFVYISVDQDLKNAYATSYFEAAIQPILADSEFTNDLRRVLKRAVQPRIVATILEERVKRTAPPEILNDPDKYTAFLNTLIAEVQTVINGLEPEDAIVGFDSIEYGYMGANKNGGTPDGYADTFKAVQALINAKVATGAKTMPAVLGHSTTSNAASAETMLYLKHADLIRRKLNEFYSRCLTISVRLMGQDCYVDFKYDQLDLRPSSELEAYRAMEQSRVLELLSLGLISDEEACVRLTGNLPPTGYTPLAGTMFKGGNSAPIENPSSGTSVMNKTLKPNTPEQPKSPSKKAEVYHLGAM